MDISENLAVNTIVTSVVAEPQVMIVIFFLLYSVVYFSVKPLADFIVFLCDNDTISMIIIPNGQLVGSFEYRIKLSEVKHNRV